MFNFLLYKDELNVFFTYFHICQHYIYCTMNFDSKYIGICIQNKSFSGLQGQITYITKFKNGFLIIILKYPCNSYIMGSKWELYTMATQFSPYGIIVDYIRSLKCHKKYPVYFWCVNLADKNLGNETWDAPYFFSSWKIKQNEDFDVRKCLHNP